jgi:hypothetical protein
LRVSKISVPLSKFYSVWGVLFHLFFICYCFVNRVIFDRFEEVYIFVFRPFLSSISIHRPTVIRFCTLNGGPPKGCGRENPSSRARVAPRFAWGFVMAPLGKHVSTDLKKRVAWAFLIILHEPNGSFLMLVDGIVMIVMPSACHRLRPWLG